MNEQEESLYLRREVCLRSRVTGYGWKDCLTEGRLHGVRGNDVARTGGDGRRNDRVRGSLRRSRDARRAMSSRNGKGKSFEKFGARELKVEKTHTGEDEVTTGSDAESLRVMAGILRETRKEEISTYRHRVGVKGTAATDEDAEADSVAEAEFEVGIELEIGTLYKRVAKRV